MRCKRRVIVFAQTLNESPSEKEGKCTRQRMYPTTGKALNESPSEKEGKSGHRFFLEFEHSPSMKVPPKRKGNQYPPARTCHRVPSLNESPSEKEGKYRRKINHGLASLYPQ